MLCVKLTNWYFTKAEDMMHFYVRPAIKTKNAKGRQKTMLESEIEKYLVKQVKAEGGIAYKFVSPGIRGVPDRIVLFPCGIMCFVELKAHGKKPRQNQIRQIEKIIARGFDVFTIDSKEKVDELIVLKSKQMFSKEVMPL